MALPATALIGCAPDGSGESPVRAGATRPAAEPPAARTANPQVGVSAGGVTTSMSAPAESTEEQYAKACMAAKEWMTARGGDPRNLVEPFLDEVQTTGSVTPATFGTGWSDLTDPQRSAVIIAVRAAADGGC
jgi:hypothetical protein